MPPKKSSAFFAFLAALTLAGCSAKPGLISDPRDPYEPVNRRIYAFNRGVDTVILEPVALGYTRLPEFMRQGITNFSTWTGHPLTAFESAFQGRFNNGFRAIANFAFALPFFGLVEPFRPEDRPEPTNADETAARHFPPGPYVELPLFGPGTVRTHITRLITALADPLNYSKQLVGDKPAIKTARTYAFPAGVITFRGNNFDLINNIKYGSVDPYARTRAFLFQNLPQPPQGGNGEGDAFDSFLDEEDAGNGAENLQ